MVARVGHKRLFAWILVLSCALAAFAACSSDEGSASNENAGGSSGSAGSSSGGNGGIAPPDGSTSQLTVDPPTATLTITSKTAPVSQQFKALWGPNQQEVTATWTLDTYDLGGVTAAGLFETTGFAGGKVTLTADYGGSKATAEAIVMVDLSEDVLADPNDPGPSAGNKAALQGPPAADPSTTFLYPYDQTVMPKGLLAPLLQLSAGSLPPEDAKVSLKSQYFSWTGFYKVQNPAQPQLTVPQPVWDAALLSAQGQKLDVAVTKASTGQAYGPYAIQVVVAAGSLKGAVYYQTYEEPNNGLWVTRPGTQSPAQLLKAGCVVCHSVSANGKRLSTGSEDGAQAAQSGVYDVDTSGNVTQIAGTPAGLGGDTRNFSFGVFTPDGKYVTRSQNNFWGGPNQLAWRVDSATGMTQANVVGLGPDVNALLPAFSPDGEFYAFTNGGEASPLGTAGRSVSVMRVTIDDNAGPAGTLTFSERKVVLDNGPGGAVTKYVTFLPDSDLIVLQESTSFYAGYDEMLPTYDPAGTPGAGNGRLFLVKASTGEHVELKRANAGNVAWDAEHNFEPFALPVPSGGYFWVVFTSNREYGNTFTGGNVRKQLWVMAVSPDWKPGEDPSHPPFFLPTQTTTKNERGFWALDPCKPQGDACQTGDECCGGCCRPSDPNNPQAKTCTTCDSAECKQLSEKCEQDSDCCYAETGIECLAGYCSPPIPQ